MATIFWISIALTILSVTSGFALLMISRNRMDTTGAGKRINARKITLNVVLLLVIPIPFFFIEGEKMKLNIFLGFLMVVAAMHLLYLIIQNKKIK